MYPYFHANHFPEKFHSGTDCEALYSFDNQWYPATLELIIDQEIPNTKIVMKRYWVKYKGYEHFDMSEVEFYCLLQSILTSNL